jgi:hypothetical protein
MKYYEVRRTAMWCNGDLSTLEECLIPEKPDPTEEDYVHELLHDWDCPVWATKSDDAGSFFGLHLSNLIKNWTGQRRDYEVAELTNIMFGRERDQARAADERAADKTRAEAEFSDERIRWIRNRGRKRPKRKKRGRSSKGSA